MREEKRIEKAQKDEAASVVVRDAFRLLENINC